MEGGGGWGWIPHRFFCCFSKKEYRLHLPFSVAVHIFLRHILTKFGENRLLWLRDMPS